MSKSPRHENLARRTETPRDRFAWRPILDHRKHGDSLNPIKERSIDRPHLVYHAVCALTDSGLQVVSYETSYREGEETSFNLGHFNLDMAYDHGFSLLQRTLKMLTQDRDSHTELKSPSCTVNLNPRQLTQRSFLLLSKYLKKNSLTLEVLEDAPLSKLQAKWLSILRKKGAQIWVDDLPAGYSVFNFSRLASEDPHLIAGIKIQNPKLITPEILTIISNLIRERDSTNPLTLVVEYITSTEEMRAALTTLDTNGLKRVILENAFCVQGQLVGPQVTAEKLSEILKKLDNGIDGIRNRDRRAGTKGASALHDAIREEKRGNDSGSGNRPDRRERK